MDYARDSKSLEPISCHSKEKHKYGFGIRLNTVTILLLGFIIIIATLNNITAQMVKPIGWLALTGGLAFAFVLYFTFLSKVGYLTKPFARYVVLSLLLVSIYALGILISGSKLQGITVTIQLLLVLCFFMFMLLFDWRHRHIRILSSIFALFVVFNFFIFIAKGLTTPFSSIYTNPNTFGALIFCTLFFLAAGYYSTKNSVKRIMWLFFILLGVALLMASSSRSVFLALVAVGATYFIWGILTKGKIIFTSYFLLVVMVISIFVGWYSLSNAAPEGSYYNTIATELTGKRLFSGRQTLWLGITDAIKEKPLFGYGTGMTPSDLIPTNISAHNLYLQIALQVGLVGLALFLLLLWQIWRQLWWDRKNQYVRLSGAFLIGILIHQSFEVCLTQNNLSIGLLQWLIIGIGTSQAIHRQRDRAYLKKQVT